MYYPWGNLSAKSNSAFLSSYLFLPSYKKKHLSYSFWWLSRDTMYSCMVSALCKSTAGWGKNGSSLSSSSQVTQLGIGWLSSGSSVPFLHPSAYVPTGLWTHRSQQTHKGLAFIYFLVFCFFISSLWTLNWILLHLFQYIIRFWSKKKPNQLNYPSKCFIYMTPSNPHIGETS